MTEPFRIERVKKKIVSYPNAVKLVTQHLFSKGCTFTKLALWFILITNRDFICRSTLRIKQLCDYLFKHHNEVAIIQASTAIGNGVIGLFGKLLYGVPLITYIHGSELHKYHAKFTTRMLQKFVLKNSDKVIANSVYTKRLTDSYHIDSSRFIVANLGADLTTFFPLDSKSKMKNKHKIPSDSKILLTISHLVKRKGHDLVIRALSNIVKEQPDIYYIIVGRGPEEERLRKLSIQLGVDNRVVFAGFVPQSELNDYMNACDIFVMPNRNEEGDVEGYGIVFIEANACKKAVIAGNSGGAVDAVIDGETGFLIDSLSEEHLRTTIMKLINDEELCKKIGEQGYNRAVNQLNWGIITNKINNHLGELF